MVEPLRMTFDPMTIEHLGVRMYSTLPPVVGELVANSYDADASYVRIHMCDTGEKEITIEDDGEGMTFDEVNTKFLRIGRNRREDEATETTPKGRKVIGKKGLGKLSFFGVAQEIRVTTVKAGTRTSFVLEWESIKRAAGSENGLSDYQPTVLEPGIDCGDEENGTTIKLSKIQRSSNFDAEGLANNLARIFICDEEFTIQVRRNEEESVEVTEERRFSGLARELEWVIPGGLQVESEYANKEEIGGLVFTAEKPISPKTNMRGITLFSRKKMVNAPEYFSDSTSSHFFSYLTGWLEVDFVDDLPEDVIGTNRRSLNWDHPTMADLRVHLQKMMRALEVDWRTKRPRKRRETLTAATGIDINHWVDNVPAGIERNLKEVIDDIVDKSQLDNEATASAARSLHELVPENTYYHWKRLNGAVHEIAQEDYISSNYFDATEKASRLYVQRVKDAGGIDLASDSNVMDAAFNLGNGKLKVTRCSNVTEQNIQTGQQHLSKGIVAGCRNPLIHNPEYEQKLVEAGLFDDDDCLDMLSLISHLFRRLERSTLRDLDDEEHS